MATIEFPDPEKVSGKLDRIFTTIPLYPPDSEGRLSQSRIIFLRPQRSIIARAAYTISKSGEDNLWTSKNLNRCSVAVTLRSQRCSKTTKGYP